MSNKSSGLDGFSMLMFGLVIVFLVHWIAKLIGRGLTMIVRSFTGYEGNVTDAHPDGAWLGWTVILYLTTYFVYVDAVERFTVFNQPTAETFGPVMVLVMVCIGFTIRSVVGIYNIAANRWPSIAYSDQV